MTSIQILRTQKQELEQQLQETRAQLRLHHQLRFQELTTTPVCFQVNYRSESAASYQADLLAPFFLQTYQHISLPTGVGTRKGGEEETLDEELIPMLQAWFRGRWQMQELTPPVSDDFTPSLILSLSIDTRKEYEQLVHTSPSPSSESNVNSLASSFPELRSFIGGIVEEVTQNLPNRDEVSQLMCETMESYQDSPDRGWY